MVRKVEADFDGLRAVADLLTRLRDNFAEISEEASGIAGDMTRACGDDEFGHEFTGGKKGFRAQCASTIANADVISESFAQYSLGIDGDQGAVQAFENSEQASSEGLRRAV
ncbi:hypothetical protein [Nocardia paucivorans]|uniref:hypothetical protein n=1 Tax=Nocardia paucivorans TaxID=114259 RepID=UPI0012F78D1E|nr:hypothetical protein [Nocardia paucivorans]